ncbi:MAG TPA: proton-conducting transporter membrane subunit [Verrucomicrobiae bacterium]|nr:proton-conducting transporter membrane subunit [Verrucomicrobiae bacterium]
MPGWVLHQPLLIGVSVGVPWFAAALLTGYRHHARIVGCAAAFVSILGSAVLLADAPKGESLYQALMLLYSCLTFGATLLLPRRDCTTGTISGILFLLGSTLLAYSTGNLLVLLAAWILSTVPFLWAGWFRARAWRPLAGLLLSSLALALAVGLISTSAGVFSIDNLKGQSPGGVAAFALLLIAVVFRKGICPAHSWVADAADTGPVVPTALLLNGHFGALLVAKLIVPLYPRTDSLFPVLSYLAIVTAVYVAIRALAENSPSRLIAFLALSQSAYILSGLESRTAEGIAGAIVHWFVVAISTMALFGILRLLEVRFGENLTVSKHFGLAEHAPRLAVSFVIFGLALVGLPGTLGFCSQDLLIHGALTSHRLIGLLLPIATAMNAISFFRLFTRLFLGKRRTGFTVMADALPRERWILAAGVLFVVFGGVFPNAVVIQRSSEADMVQEAIHTAAELNPVGKVNRHPGNYQSLPRADAGPMAAEAHGRALSWVLRTTFVGASR